jgi:hypothetical protein
MSDNEEKNKEKLYEILCSICFDVLDNNYIKLGCTHKYHMNCLFKWCKIICPICKQNYNIDTLDLSRDQKIKCYILFFESRVKQFPFIEDMYKELLFFENNYDVLAQFNGLFHIIVESDNN